MKSVAAFSLLALAATFSYGDDAATRKAIQARYADISKAFATKNSKAFEAGFTDDFTAKGPDGKKVTRAQVFKDFEGQMKALSDVVWTQTIKSLKVDGKVVHVMIDSQMTAMLPGQNGTSHKFKLQSKDTKSDWVKGAKGWQVKYSETGNLKIWIDGKPFGGKA